MKQKRPKARMKELQKNVQNGIFIIEIEHSSKVETQTKKMEEVIYPNNIRQNALKLPAIG